MYFAWSAALTVTPPLSETKIRVLSVTSFMSSAVAVCTANAPAVIVLVPFASMTVTPRMSYAAMPHFCHNFW